MKQPRLTWGLRIFAAGFQGPLWHRCGTDSIRKPGLSSKAAVRGAKRDTTQDLDRWHSGVE
jgi:hypothetical protein